MAGIDIGVAMVQEELNAVSERIAGCETVAFVDLSTNMSLVNNSDSPETQDTLSKLTAEGVLTLKSSATAMVGHPSRTHLFLKSDSEPNDALCCILQPETDLTDALPALQDCLAKISDYGSSS